MRSRVPIKVCCLLLMVAAAEKTNTCAASSEGCAAKHADYNIQMQTRVRIGIGLTPESIEDELGEAAVDRRGSSCSGNWRSCLISHCCVDPDFTCWEKDATEAKCRRTSSGCPNAWSCNVLSTTTTTPPATTLPAVDHLTADAYHAQLRRGVVVSWAEFKKDIKAYKAQGKRFPELLHTAIGDVANPAENNYDHMRVRFNGDDLFDDTSNVLDLVIDDALITGLSVLIAHKGWTNEKTWTRAGFIQSWRRVAAHYRNHSDKLAFNIFIEVSHVMCHHASTCELLTIMTDGVQANALYIETIKAIRESNPTRVIVIPGPGKLNRPASLLDLDWNSLNAEGVCKVNGIQYCFTEWHVAAAGPCNPMTISNVNPNYACSTTEWAVQWTGAHGKDAEQAHVEHIVKYAADFTKASGIKTWVGAFMPGPYRHAERGYYTKSEQAGFVSYYAALLHKHGIPFACLSGSAAQFGSPPCYRTMQVEDFYAKGTYITMPDGTIPPTCNGTAPVEWIPEMRSVRNAVLQTYDWNTGV